MLRIRDALLDLRDAFEALGTLIAETFSKLRFTFKARETIQPARLMCKVGHVDNHGVHPMMWIAAHVTRSKCQRAARGAQCSR